MTRLEWLGVTLIAIAILAPVLALVWETAYRAGALEGRRQTYAAFQDDIEAAYLAKYRAEQAAENYKRTALDLMRMHGKRPE